MRTHQKYFSLFGQTKFSEKGEVFDTTKKEFFSPFFLFVSNIKSPDDNIIIKGNEKVLSARLSDALYFYQQDLKKPLLDSLNKLDKVIFHAKLGSMKQKTARLAQLTKYITSHFQQKEAEDAALLCKSDLVSEMVGEFPELQGIMGYYYAIAEGRDKKIAIAIRDHYKPRGSSDSIPGDPNLGGDASAVLALADKIDSLCGLMLAGEKPTSSKDPYGLRRLALGIIRIILENRLEHDLKKLIEHSCDLYPKGVNSNSEDADQIISFIEDRVKNYFKEEFDLARVNAVVNCRLEPFLCSIKWKLEALNSFLDTEDGKTSLNSYKRASNILGSAKLNGEINTNLLHREEEKKLLEFLKLATPKIDSLIEEKMFSESLNELAKVNNLIGNFFDNVMVMDSDAKIANNRLLLLARTKQLFNKVANFDQL
jgi:glycyl-tRNA synthetase beta chain